MKPSTLITLLSSLLTVVCLSFSPVQAKSYVNTVKARAHCEIKFYQKHLYVFWWNMGRMVEEDMSLDNCVELAQDNLKLANGQLDFAVVKHRDTVGKFTKLTIR